MIEQPDSGVRGMEHWECEECCPCGSGDDLGNCETENCTYQAEQDKD